MQVLSNLTRDLAGCRQVVTALTKAGVGIATLVDLLSRYDFPLVTCSSRDLGTVVVYKAQPQILSPPAAPLIPVLP